MRDDFKKARQLIFQIITVIVIFTAAVYALWRINLVRLPTFIENLITNKVDVTNDYTNNGYEIFNHINQSNDAEFESIYPEIESVYLTEILNSIKPYEHFYWESRSEIYSSEGLRVSDCKSRISGNKYNIEVLNEQGNTVRKCISNGEKTVIFLQGAYGLKSKEYNRGLNDFYSDSSIISVDYFKNTDFSNLNTNVRLVNNENSKLVSIVYSYDRNGTVVKNSFLVSLDFGVVLFAECTENDIVVYKLQTNSIYPLSSLDSDIFSIT